MNSELWFARMFMDKLEEFLSENHIYLEVLHSFDDNPIITALVQFDDTKRQIDGCGSIITKTGFANLMRKYPENIWAMANFSYNKEEQAATITFIPHAFLIELIDATNVMAHSFGLMSVHQETHSLDDVVSGLISLNEKYEQCYYSTLIVDEDLLDALRNDGEFLTGYLDEESSVVEQLSIEEHYNTFIKQLDALSFHF